jgi:hypothetical protein
MATPMRASHTPAGWEAPPVSPRSLGAQGPARLRVAAAELWRRRKE